MHSCTSSLYYIVIIVILDPVVKCSCGIGNCTVKEELILELHATVCSDIIRSYKKVFMCIQSCMYRVIQIFPCKTWLQINSASQRQPLPGYTCEGCVH